ncbi:ATP-binding protein [Alteribacillus bidgolensis]|uniref:histidine kinase n=1 Tax=Alteribacillus bidgolensis TaxID=930129 RepID=A0A1G8KZC4_9BACI|nr:sensor histidine kinase [Alteribacillus bidgolensis]SDI48875.1 two-component system, CitB family, sensor histidine kinase DctS [Alteribacillus bidgolensis]
MGIIGRMPIRGKITFLVFSIVLFTFIMIGIILLGYASDVKEEELTQRAMITSQNLAQNQTVKDSVTELDGADQIQPIAERIRKLNEIDYVVVLNMNKIRLSHPIPDRLYSYFNSDDAEAAFSEHVYTTKAKANDDITVRAFVPIMNDNQEQVGVVVSGNILPSTISLIEEFRNPALLIFIITILFGTWGAWLLASHIKNQTFEMEPEDLARVLVERTATFHAIHEGVIAIDEQEKITVMNHAAKKMLSVAGEPIGRPIQEVIPDTRLPEVLEMNRAVYQKEFYVQNRAILSNRIPIKVNNKTVGAVAIFQDKTEVNRLAEELTGVKTFVDALRVQNHEYSNKLHTIAGLIQMDEGKKALEFIYDVTNSENNFIKRVSDQIHDDSITGLLIGKSSRGRELGVELTLSRQSYFNQYPEGIHSNDLVVILGNLIDNSFDAMKYKEGNDKKVFVHILESEQALMIRVEDNGTGIKETVLKHIFERGYSTKGSEGRGIGMFLVKSIVDRIDGQIDISSDKESTEMMIILPMKRKEGT